MRRRAFTLAEMLVAMAIGSFVTLMVVSMFTTGLTLSRVFSEEQDVLRRGTVIVTRVSREVDESDFSKATVTPTAVAFPGARGDGGGPFATNDTTGEPDWNTLWVLYVNQAQELRLVPIPLASVAKIPLPAGDVEALCKGGDLLARGCTSFAALILPVEADMDPVITNSTFQKKIQVPAKLVLDFGLSYQQRTGQRVNCPFHEVMFAHNSFSRAQPHISPSPTATPPAPDKEPRVPMDWN